MSRTGAAADALHEVAELIRRESGIDLPEVRRTALGAAIRRAGVAGPEELLARVRQDGGPALIGRLLDEVTVQETSFLRDSQQLRGIDWQALRAGAAAARGAAAPVRVWSAGCATGEEAYTLALLATEALGDAPVDVLGTDISAAALTRAQAARYRARRARNVPAALRARLLAEDGPDAVVVRPALRRLVRFARHNLVADPSPPAGEGPFDLVVCRNVLIYFDPGTADAVVQRLRGALRPGGSLLLGFADQLGRSGRPGAAPGARLAEGAAAAGGPRPTLPPVAAAPGISLLGQALVEADAGRTSEALACTELLLARDPMNAGGHFLRGLIQLADDPHAAIGSLRRALLIDPRFGLAAFQLGRAYEAAGDPAAARAAYEQALHTLDPDDVRYAELLRQVDIGDVATAIRARIQVLR